MKGAARTMRSPRTVLGVAVALLAVLLALFTVALVRSNTNDRKDAERRFQERAKESAALTESIFSSTSQQDDQQSSERYGGATVDQKRLDCADKQSQLVYSIVAASAQAAPRPAKLAVTARPGMATAIPPSGWTLPHLQSPTHRICPPPRSSACPPSPST